MNNEKLTWQDLTFDTNAVIEASAGTGQDVDSGAHRRKTRHKEGESD